MTEPGIVRGPLPVPGNVHYGHSWDFSYSPLQLLIHCGYYVAFVLKRRGKSDSLLVNWQTQTKPSKSLSSVSSVNTRRLLVPSEAFLGLGYSIGITSFCSPKQIPRNI